MAINIPTFTTRTQTNKLRIMTSPSNAFGVKTAPACQPFAIPGLYTDTTSAHHQPSARQAPPEILKERFGQSISALAHEIRNPLTNIDLAAEMLCMGIKDETMSLYLDIIKRSSVRINDLVNELLKFRLANQAPAKKYSVHQLLDEVLEMAGDRLMLKKITVSKEYAAGDCEIAPDKTKLGIALTNIVINAIDAMAPGTGELKLVTKCVDNKYILQIEDNGCGISKDNLKNIFKPYFTHRKGGLGLGLATTYDILQAANVGVFVASEEGIGTRFVLMFDKSQG